MPTLIALKVFSARAPISSNECERITPPVMITFRFGREAISSAVVSELVTIVRSLRSAGPSTTSAVVVPPERATA